jgi:hypothetical protein
MKCRCWGTANASPRFTAAADNACSIRFGRLFPRTDSKAYGIHLVSRKTWPFDLRGGWGSSPLRGSYPSALLTIRSEPRHNLNTGPPPS